MKVSKELASYKRFGTKYGRTVKERFAKAEASYKGRRTCPYCHYKKVKRIAPGIWQCQKCKVKFTAGAYSLKREK
jgi:large subunit ribosomal protein L37Ae